MTTPDFSGKTLGQYHLYEVLGMGGMGVVYRAYQATLQREVAIKVLPASLATQSGYSERFQREARTAAALEHAHIVPILDYGSDQGLSYVVMRLLKGGSLAQRLEQHPNRRPALSEISGLLSHLAGALDYAHGRGVVHRDLKPSNIMFDEVGSPYLVDFGIAKLAGSATALTASGMMLGTPAYMAPEQWQNQPIGPATDQYALAVVIYAILTGRLPFDADTPYALMFQHINQPPPSAHEYRGDIPLAIADSLSRALAKSPAQRFPTASAFAQAFALGIQHIPPETTGYFTTHITPTGHPLHTPSAGSLGGGSSGTITIQRRSLWIGAALLGVVLLLAVGLVVLFSGERDSTTPTPDQAALLESAIAATVLAREQATTPTPSPTETEMPPSATATVTVTVTVATSPAPTDTPSLTASDTEAPSATASPTPDPTATVTASLTPSATASNTLTATPTPTDTPTPRPTIVQPTRTALPGFEGGLVARVSLLRGQTAPILANPDLGAAVLFNLEPDSEVGIIRSEGVWVLVEYRGFTGWMLAGNLQPFTPPSATPTPTDTPTPRPVTPTTTPAPTYRVRSATAMRADPNANALQLFLLPVDSEVRLLEVQGSWAYIEYRGFTGWALYQALVEVTPTPRPRPTLSEAYATGRYVEVRVFNPNGAAFYQAPDIGSTLLGSLPNSTWLVTQALDGLWLQVTYENRTGWLLGSTVGVLQVEVNVPTLNLRSGPGTSYSIQRTAIAGERFYIRGYDATFSWIEIELSNDSSAWVSSELVTLWLRQ